jgi:hypothetical protein
MTVKGFTESLSKLKHAPVRVTASNAFPEAGAASVELLFENGSTLRADYWRLIIDGKAGISSFDHKQKYGLPTPIDAIKVLEDLLQSKLVTNAYLDYETGDLLFHFDGGIRLRVFNFTSYEIWEVHFPDGTGEYSNYVK